jgi:hypothetical protein
MWRYCGAAKAIFRSIVKQYQRFERALRAHFWSLLGDSGIVLVAMRYFAFGQRCAMSGATGFET